VNGQTRLTRRAMMRATATVGVAAPLGTVLQSEASAQVKTSAKARAFALIGDESHNSDYIRSALGSTLVRDAGLPIDFTDEEKELSYDALKRYRILIMFRDGLRFPDGYAPRGTGQTPAKIVSVPPIQKKVGSSGVGWMTDEQGKAVKRWVQEGGSLWAFHNNSQLSLMNKDYRDVEGAIFTGHPPFRPFKVKITNRDHPITKGVEDFVVTDEQHFVVYEKDPKYVLAISVNEDGLTYKDQSGKTSNTCESVWAYDYGKGRVCFMAPGHAVTVMWNPEYEKMQKNALKWLLHEEGA
jgi:type 1 glutamine amidotransferase